MIVRALGALALAACAVVLSPGAGLDAPEDGAIVIPATMAAAGGTSESLAPKSRHPQANVADTSTRVQAKVEYAFSQVLPDEQVTFALDSAQATRVEGGGRHFEGSGTGRWGPGDVRLVSFEMTLSATGELVEFDYSTPLDAPKQHDAEQLASY